VRVRQSGLTPQVVGLLKRVPSVLPVLEHISDIALSELLIFHPL
jgi:hypothetical protein